jgi:hypothetical protein
MGAEIMIIRMPRASRPLETRQMSDPHEWHLASDREGDLHEEQLGEDPTIPPLPLRGVH